MPCRRSDNDEVVPPWPAQVESATRLQLAPMAELQLPPATTRGYTSVPSSSLVVLPLQQPGLHHHFWRHRFQIISFQNWRITGIRFLPEDGEDGVHTVCSIDVQYYCVLQCKFSHPVLICFVFYLFWAIQQQHLCLFLF